MCPTILYFLYWHTEVFKAQYIHSQPYCNQPFLQGPLVFFSGEWYLEIEIWSLSLVFLMGLSLLLGLLWVDIEVGKLDICILFLFPSFSLPPLHCTLILFLCIFRTHEFKLIISNISSTPHIFILAFSLSTFYFTSQTVWNLVSIILNMFTYLFNPHVCNQFPDHTGHHLSFSATSQEVPILFPYVPMVENINF